MDRTSKIKIKEFYWSYWTLWL